jgi:hypothetical protein
MIAKSSGMIEFSQHLNEVCCQRSCPAAILAVRAAIVT